MKYRRMVQACLGTSTPTEGHSAFMQHPTGIGVARSTPPSFGLSKERVRQAFVRRWRIPSSCRQSSGCRKLLGQWSHTLPSKTEPVQSGDALHVFLYTSILFSFKLDRILSLSFPGRRGDRHERGHSTRVI